MAKRRQVYVARATAITFLAAAALLSSCSPRAKATDQEQPPVVQVVRMTAAPAEVTRSLNGRIVPFLTAEIRPQIGGIVQRRLFAEGSVVQVGQVLFQIEDRLYASALRQAQAQLESAHASLTAAAAKAGRFTMLENTNAATAQDLDDARTAAAQAAALVHEREAALETARTNLDYTRVRAPISGRIGRSEITVGALVTPGQPAVLAIVQSVSTVFADLALPLVQDDGAHGGGDALPPSRGTAVRIFTEGDRHNPLVGHVAFTDVAVAPDTQTTIVRVKIDNPGRRLLPGMFVRGDVAVAAPAAATMVPQSAVSVDTGDQGSVLVVDGHSRALRRAVTLGPTIGAAWMVTSGLAPGDRVVVAGGAKVAPGDPVRVRSGTRGDAR